VGVDPYKEERMKKILVLALAIVIAGAALSLAGCGSKGADGLVYLELDWYYYYTLHYNITSTDIPYVDYETYHRHDPGSWTLYYYLDDGYYYSSTYQVDYTLEADPGSVGLFPGMTGSDGQDHWYTLYCGWYGATLYDDGLTSVKSVTPKSAFNPNAGQDEYTQQVKSNGWTMTIHVKKVPSAPAGIVFSTK
jgi:hypothetical protein